MADVQEFEDLDELMRSAGWQRFKAYTAEQWGTPSAGGGARFQLAVRASAAENADADAIAKLRQVVAAQREIQGLITEFEKRLDAVRPQENRLAAVGSRRGPL
jgi:hypothetical protein